MQGVPSSVKLGKYVDSSLDKVSQNCDFGHDSSDRAVVLPSDLTSNQDSLLPKKLISVSIK
jgi:hypothetical protein